MLLVRVLGTHFTPPEAQGVHDGRTPSPSSPPPMVSPDHLENYRAILRRGRAIVYWPVTLVHALRSHTDY